MCIIQHINDALAILHAAVDQGGRSGFGFVKVERGLAVPREPRTSAASAPRQELIRRPLTVNAVACVRIETLATAITPIRPGNRQKPPRQAPPRT